MRAIAPRTGAPEQTFAEHQEEFFPVTVALYHDPRENVTMGVTRWAPSDLERAQLARHIIRAALTAFVNQVRDSYGAGVLAMLDPELERFLTDRPFLDGDDEDVYLMLHLNRYLTPHNVYVGCPAWARVDPAAVVPLPDSARAPDAPPREAMGNATGDATGDPSAATGEPEPGA